jgi:hypothetical protein
VKNFQTSIRFNLFVLDLSVFLKRELKFSRGSIAVFYISINNYAIRLVIYMLYIWMIYGGILFWILDNHYYIILDNFFQQQQQQQQQQQCLKYLWQV